MDPTGTTTETITGTEATEILTLPAAGEATGATEEAGPGLISTEGREVLREELPVAVEAVVTLDLVVGTEVEAEGEEALRGTNLTNNNLQCCRH